MSQSDDSVVPFTPSPFTLGAGFSAVEPEDDQRWSTWPATTPSGRGPRPHPPWVVTSAGAIDTELGILKTGKEADVHLLRRAVPDGAPYADGAADVVLAAKRYRSPEMSDFHRSAIYQEGRRLRRSRDTRAVARGSHYGRAVAAGQWAMSEFGALCRLYELGAPVPYPVQVHGTELLMEFIGDGVTAAPRLAQAGGVGIDLADAHAQVVEILRLFARAGLAHGDLSPYNLLVHHGRVVVIDVPQVVDVVGNPNGMELLERDCRNICEWMTRRGLECDTGELFAEVLAEMF